jgi:hypothetical protein
MVAGNAAAGSLYRWVDKEGKVHYSESPPVETPTTETKIHVRTPAGTPDDSEIPKSDYDANGNCATIKCMADQMEAERLERERGYARQRQENEQAATSEKQKSASRVIDSAAGLRDEKLRTQCLNGVYYGANSKVNCNDAAALRNEYSRWQQQNK